MIFFRAISTRRPNVVLDGEVATNEHRICNAQVKAKLVEGAKNGEFQEGEKFRVSHYGAATRTEEECTDAWTMIAKEGRRRSAKPKAKKQPAAKRTAKPKKTVVRKPAKQPAAKAAKPKAKTKPKSALKRKAG
jgi:hypothetical protein